MKRVNPSVRGLHFGAIEHGLLVLVRPIANRLTRFAALAEIIDIRPDALGPRHLVRIGLIGPTADPDRIARFGEVLGLHQ